MLPPKCPCVRCGLRYLSLALSALCPRVTAVDTSREALCVLRENMEKNGVRNIAVWEAEAFFRLYDQQDGGPPLSKAELWARLTETESAEFPYYLPSGRSVGMIVLERENIPDSIQ